MLSAQAGGTLNEIDLQELVQVALLHTSRGTRDTCVLQNERVLVCSAESAQDVYYGGFGQALSSFERSC